MTNSVLRSSEAIINQVDVEDLAKITGLKGTNPTPEDKKAKKAAEKRKAALLQAYNAKAKILLNKLLAPQSTNTEENENMTDASSDSYVSLSPAHTSTSEEFEYLYQNYHKWFESATSDAKFGLIFARRELLHKRWVM